VGTVFKKTFTKPLPPGAETFVRKGQRWARWRDRKGKQRTARLTTGKDGRPRVLLECPYYVAQYKDAAGLVQVVSTGCRDETAARRVLGELERQAELVRTGVVSPDEVAAGAHRGRDLEEHFAAFAAHLQAKGATARYRAEVLSGLRRLAADCSFQTLAHLRREPLERWLVLRGQEGMSARTRNAYQAALAAFANWCVASGRMAVNPFARMGKANEKADRRRQRRALEEHELMQLLDAARRRPLLDAQTVNRGPRKGQAGARPGEATRRRLERLGRERALLYKTLVLTGLRRGELASLTVARLHLDGPVCFARLGAADEKNRQGSDVPLRDDLAADLRAWLADKLIWLQEDCRRQGRPVPLVLPPDTPVFYVPGKLVEILNRDLVLAGLARWVTVGGKVKIDKRDARGRTLDVHALRTTFGTLLSKGGVAPRTAQAALRHADINLTMNVYTDPKLLDVHGALEALPELPLEDAAEPGKKRLKRS
jgi:integrase